jgi:hypothetical protein
MSLDGSGYVLPTCVLRAVRGGGYLSVLRYAASAFNWSSLMIPPQWGMLTIGARPITLPVRIISVIFLSVPKSWETSARERWDRLVRRLRVGLRPVRGGHALPYAWVPEWHPGGHGLHVHFAVGRFVSQTLIRDAWGRGHVHIKLLGDLPVGSGTLAEARLAARYLSKYVGKGLDDERRRGGLHRYEVAQGYQPERVVCAGSTENEVIAQASECDTGRLADVRCPHRLAFVAQLAQRLSP